VINGNTNIHTYTFEVKTWLRNTSN
jgi:hypothetical protein